MAAGTLKEKIITSVEGEGRTKAFDVEDEKSVVENEGHSDPASHNSINSRAKQRFSSLSARIPRKLVDLCLGVLGQHLEDILGQLADISVILPRNIKMAIIAMARRKKLLDDGILIALVDESWDTLDISGSDVSDVGLLKVSQICSNLYALDIRKCRKITALGVSAVVSQCRSLQILRWGGCPSSESTARRCLSILMPKLNTVEEESWENLEDADLVDGAQSLHWLVWPNIDPDSKARLVAECPRIAVNPRSSPFSLRGVQVPPGADLHRALDEPYVAGINPRTWETCTRANGQGSNVSIDHHSPSSSDHRQPMELSQLSVAEKFRLAFVERDQRLAPKRAKNLRQHQRRADKEWAASNADAKSIVLASKFRTSLKY
ncbi:RNI-like superfamily protein [Wolffia australiana]